MLLMLFKVFLTTLGSVIVLKKTLVVVECNIKPLNMQQKYIFLFLFFVQELIVLEKSIRENLGLVKGCLTFS